VDANGQPAGAAGSGTAPAPGDGCAGRAPGDMDLEILDCLGEIFGFLVSQGDEVARRLGLPGFFVKALHLLDHPMAMKDLGKRMHCDPSFVTGIADLLEQRELAVREPDPADRRVKRLVLTPAGEELRQQLHAEVLARLPWRQALDGSERACLLGHLTTAVRSLREQAPAPARTGKGVSADLIMPQPGDSGA
jgi:DNA-binding MarR family transcriptional regulator